MNGTTDVDDKLSLLYYVVNALLDESYDYNSLVSSLANHPTWKGQFAIVNDIHAVGVRPGSLQGHASRWTQKCLNWDTGGSVGAPTEFFGLPMFTRGIDTNMLQRSNMDINFAGRFTASRRCSAKNLAYQGNSALWNWKAKKFEYLLLYFSICQVVKSKDKYHSRSGYVLEK
jgi:hypothetical protein